MNLLDKFLNMPFDQAWLIFTIGSCIFFFLVIMIPKVLRSPFEFPYFVHTFDVSGKRKPQIYDYIDEYLIEEGMDEIDEYVVSIGDWKRVCEKRIKRSILKRLRRKQFEQALDEENAFQFTMVREQTRYRQSNYQKYAYTVGIDAGTHKCSYDELLDRYHKLEAIGFETTLRKYNSKEQRRLMTPELKKSIKMRDNYTCQCCGKYMPDEVGLHVDHIIPVTKGGKSVPSNLQVLCDKCNLRKHDHV